MAQDDVTSSRGRRRRYAWVRLVILDETGGTILDENGNPIQGNT